MKKLRREFHSRSKAFACLLTMCAGFSDAYTFIERGGTLAAGFLPKEVPNVLIVPFFGLSLGIVAISFGEVDGYAYNHSFMTGNLKKTMDAYGNFVRERKMEFFWESLFMTSLIGSFVGGAILSTFLIQYYGLRTIWFVSLVLTIFLTYRAIQYVRRDA